eukprot:COSAG01_NODE_157_length_23722_cov_85.712568_3_plen_53_part_00
MGSNFIYDGGTHAPREERPIAATRTTSVAACGLRPAAACCAAASVWLLTVGM